VNKDYLKKIVQELRTVKPINKMATYS